VTLISPLSCRLAPPELVPRVRRYPRAIGTDAKGNVSLVLYIVGIASTWVSSALALVFYVAVAVIWLVPDRRIERALQKP